MAPAGVDEGSITPCLQMGPRWDCRSSRLSCPLGRVFSMGCPAERTRRSARPEAERVKQSKVEQSIRSDASPVSSTGNRDFRSRRLGCPLGRGFSVGCPAGGHGGPRSRDTGSGPPRDLPARKNSLRRKHCSPHNLRLPPPLPLMPHLEIFSFLACTLCVYC